MAQNFKYVPTKPFDEGGKKYIENWDQYTKVYRIAEESAPSLLEQAKTQWKKNLKQIREKNNSKSTGYSAEEILNLINKLGGKGGLYDQHDADQNITQMVNNFINTFNFTEEMQKLRAAKGTKEKEEDSQKIAEYGKKISSQICNMANIVNQGLTLQSEVETDNEFINWLAIEMERKENSKINNKFLNKYRQKITEIESFLWQEIQKYPDSNRDWACGKALLALEEKWKEKGDARGESHGSLPRALQGYYTLLIGEWMEYVTRQEIIRILEEEEDYIVLDLAQVTFEGKSSPSDLVVIKLNNKMSKEDRDILKQSIYNKAKSSQYYINFKDVLFEHEHIKNIEGLSVKSNARTVFSETKHTTRDRFNNINYPTWSKGQNNLNPVGFYNLVHFFQMHNQFGDIENQEFVSQKLFAINALVVANNGIEDLHMEANDIMIYRDEMIGLEEQLYTETQYKNIFPVWGVPGGPVGPPKAAENIGSHPVILHYF